MSTTGLYFVTAQPLSPGQMIAVTISLGADHRRIRGVGRVARVERKGRAFGVGLELRQEPMSADPSPSRDDPTSG